MLIKPNGAVSLGRVLVFLFGLEILVLMPFIVIYNTIKKPDSTTALIAAIAYLAFFTILFCALIYNKTIDAKIDRQGFTIGVKDGEQK